MDFRFPAPSEVDRELYIVFYNYTYELDILFPAPTEVDRFLYVMKGTFKPSPYKSFRPLARWIGSYTKTLDFIVRDYFKVSVPSQGR